MGFEMLSSTIMDYIVDECFNNTEILLKSTQPKGGEMSVVMGKGSSGVLLHEAVGHAFEADFIRNKKSIFSEQLGKQICSKEINIVDDGTIPFNRGALNYDDEGVLTQKTYLVKEGVVNSFLHDRISANHFGIKSTGNGRRESFRCQPIPRMRATYMQSGTCTEESLIKEVKNGIYVTNLSNGQVEIGRGDFTFYVKNGYLIENGKITTPIKDVNIIGSGPQVLKDIIGVANNSLIDNSRWTCGKAQSVEVSCGMPSVLIKKLIVGGYN